MAGLWTLIRHRLGTDHLIKHAHQQENNMAKLADELSDIARRQTAIRDAIAASSDNLRTALDKLNAEVDALRSGDLSAEDQARVDAIKAAADEIRVAAESADDGYEAPKVETSPFSPTDDGSVAGSVEARTAQDRPARSKR